MGNQEHTGKTRKAETGPIAVPAKSPLLHRAVRQAEPFTAPPIVHDVLRSPGRPLDETTRASMEPRFGHDFSHVRVHSDSKAAVSAQAVNALAYTVGSDIVLGAGSCVLGTVNDNALLAHELTHVVQQEHANHATGTIVQTGPPDDAYERQADANAVALSALGPAEVAIGGIAAAALSVQRKAAVEGSRNSAAAEVDTGSKTLDKESDCSGWQRDPQSLSKVAAEHYVQTELGLSAGLVKTIVCDTTPLCCREAGGIASCVVTFANGVAITVTIYPDRIQCWRPNSLLCVYSYTCPSSGKPVFRKLRCS